MVHFGVNKVNHKEKNSNSNSWSVDSKKTENSDFTLKFGSKPSFDANYEVPNIDTGRVEGGA